jgi:hypothetical protein
VRVVWAVCVLLVGVIVVRELGERSGRGGRAGEADARLLLAEPVARLGAIEVLTAGRLHRFERDAAGAWLYHGSHSGAESAGHEHAADSAQTQRISAAFDALGRARVEREFPRAADGRDYGTTAPQIVILLYRPREPQPLAQYALGDVARTGEAAWSGWAAGGGHDPDLSDRQSPGSGRLGGGAGAPMRPRRLAAGLALAMALAPVSGAPHTGGSTGHAGITVEGATIRYRLTLWPATLPPATAEELRGARAGDAGSRDRLLAIIRDKVALRAEGARCAPGAGSLALGPPGVESVTLTVEFRCPAPMRDLHVRDDIFDAFGPDHHTVGRIDGAGATTPFAFAPDRRELRVALGGEGGARGLAGFVALGVEHIVTGWDHLLLLALLLTGAASRHGEDRQRIHRRASVTLTRRAGCRDAPNRLVESVIALSIAAVATENLFARPTVTRRWIVSFAFGLVHGFGFSTALRDLSLPTESLVLSLFGFNAGVELGQAAVVLVAVPALGLVRRAGWERRMVWALSAAILVVGLALFVERALL